MDDNWFSWDGHSMTIPKKAGQFKYFQKIEAAGKEHLFVTTEKKTYNVWWDGKKFRLQGLK